jgi:hypothetical protein
MKDFAATGKKRNKKIKVNDGHRKTCPTYHL